MRQIFTLLTILLPLTVFAQLPGNSLQLKADDNCVTVPDSLSNSLNINMTLEAWVYYNCENGTAPQYIISKGWCSTTASFLVSLTGGAIRFQKWRNMGWVANNCSSGTSVVFQTATKAVPFNKWSHIAVSIVDTHVQIYLNGQLVPITTRAGTNTSGYKTSTEPIAIGAFKTQIQGYQTIVANIDDVRIWHKAKTQAEIQSEMNIELTGNEADLFAYWKLNETGTGAGIVALNSATSTGAAYNGTTVGTAANIFFTHTDSVQNSISNCDPLLWLRADKGVVFNANKEVSTWQDQGKLGNNVSIATATSKPKFKANEINDKPIVRFDGLDDYMASTNIDLSAVKTVEVFYVAKSRNEGYVMTHNNDPSFANAFSIIENSSSGTTGHSAVLNGNGTANASCKTLATDSCYHLMNVQFDKILTGLNQIKIYRNQVSVANTNGTVAGAEMTNNLSLAALYIGGSTVGTVAHLDGDIAEVIVYNKILGTAERSAVYDYLNTKYFSNIPSTQFSTTTTTTTFGNATCDDAEWRHSFNLAQPASVLTSLKSECLIFDERTDSVFVEPTAVPYAGDYFMRRHFTINPATEYLGPKTVRLYYTLADFTDLQSYIPSLTNHNQLVVTQYDGANEDGIYDPNGGTTNFISAAQITADTAYGIYYLEFEVAHFSEFWIHVTNAPLAISHVQLLLNQTSNMDYLSWSCYGDCAAMQSYTVLAGKEPQSLKPVKTISANATSTNYQSMHSISAATTHYYAIEATDAQGKVSTSNICVAKSNDARTMLDCSTSGSTVQLTAYDTRSTIHVYNVHGQIMHQGKHHLTLNRGQLASGIYFAKVTGPGQEQQSITFFIN